MAQHGEFLWHELITTDTAACRDFYKGLLAWEAQDYPMEVGGEPYRIWIRAGKQHGGMMRMAGPEWADIPPHWMIYVGVDDCDAAAAKVAALGGSVRVAPFDVADVGRIAVIADPAGAVIGIMTPAKEG